MLSASASASAIAPRMPLHTIRCCQRKLMPLRARCSRPDTRDHAGPVVQQALGFYEVDQAVWNPQLAKDSNHRHRVGWCNHRPEQDGDGNGEAQGRVTEQGHRTRRQDDANRCQHRHSHQVAAQLSPAQVERRLEEQAWQQHEEDQGLGQRYWSRAEERPSHETGECEGADVGDRDHLHRQRDGRSCHQNQDEFGDVYMLHGIRVGTALPARQNAL